MFGVERTVSDATLARLREQLGDAPRPTPQTVPLVGSPDWGHGELVGELICEAGEVWQLDGWLPPEVPYGYHRLSGPNAIDRLQWPPPPLYEFTRSADPAVCPFAPSRTRTTPSVFAM